MAARGARLYFPLRMCVRAVLVALVLALPAPERCSGRDDTARHRGEPSLKSRLRSVSDAAVEGPVRMEALEASTPATFVMRGGPRGPGRLVFLHGMCGHALGYVQSFQWSAAAKGLLIAPQGDVACGDGPWAAWSKDIDALDARIVGTFRALGEDGLIEDVALIGYSQGATRAEALARRFPERYTRLVLIGAPDVPSPRGLSRLRAAVMMAGDRDNQAVMKAGAEAFRAAGIPSTFQPIPEARHGEMGPHPERTMRRALDWLWGD